MTLLKPQGDPFCLVSSPAGLVLPANSASSAKRARQPAASSRTARAPHMSLDQQAARQHALAHAHGCTQRSPPARRTGHWRRGEQGVGQHAWGGADL